MAFTSGTASNYVDFVNKLEAFLFSNGWSGLATATAPDANGNPRMWKAPGTADDPSYFQVTVYANASTDTYGMSLASSVAHLASNPYNQQPVQSAFFHMPLWNDAIPYWFVCSPRRAICAARVSTSYQCAYFGQILPYGAPHQYPYPVLVAGMASSDIRWSGNCNSIITPVDSATLYVPAGLWLSLHTTSDAHKLKIWPPPSSWDGGSATFDRVLPWPDGSYTVLPLIVLEHQTTERGVNVYGEADGIYRVPGLQQTAENILSINGVDHLVLQNGARATGADYLAIKLT